MLRSIIFAQNGKKSLRNINFSLKTTGNKAQAIKLMMYALNITIWYVRTTKIFHNITITLCFKSVTSPVTSKIHQIHDISKMVTFPGEFLMKFYIFGMREYISKGF